MRITVQTINWKNGDETNFPAAQCPEIEVNSNDTNQAVRDIALIAETVNAKAQWSSMVCVILPD